MSNSIIVFDNDAATAALNFTKIEEVKAAIQKALQAYHDGEAVMVVVSVENANALFMELNGQTDDKLHTAFLEVAQALATPLPVPVDDPK